MAVRAEHSKVMVEHDTRSNSGGNSTGTQPIDADENLDAATGESTSAARAWADHASQLPPQPVQPIVQPPIVPVKPAPAARHTMPTSSSSSMSGAPVNAPFPTQMSADPWFQAREQNQQ